MRLWHIATKGTKQKRKWEEMTGGNEGRGGMEIILLQEMMVR